MMLNNKSALKFISVASVILLVIIFATFSAIQGLDVEKKEEDNVISDKVKSPLRVSRYSSSAQVREDRIFFHETSGTNYLNFRQMCSVESAALHNPTRPITLFLHTNEQPNPCSPWTDIVRNYPNIEIQLLDEAAFFDGTQFEKVYSTLTENRPFFISKYVRVLNALNGGGTYSDLDIIFTRRLQFEGNFFAFEQHNNSKVEGHIFQMAKNHEMLKEIAQEMALLVPSKHSEPLSTALNKVLPKYCETELNPLTDNCSDVSLLPYHLFYPKPVTGLSMMFYMLTEKELYEFKINGTIGIHIWNQQSDHIDLDFDPAVVFTRIFEENCPFTVSAARKLEDQ